MTGLATGELDVRDVLLAAAIADEEAALEMVWVLRKTRAGGNWLQGGMVAEVV